MEARRRTWFDARGLIVGDRALPFYAGALHYWRVEPGRWAACLRAMRGLGLTIVETYVPWRVHEPAPGVFDWTRPNDLAAFVEAARAAGLAVVVRPGPHVNAELTCFGMPDHVIRDPACQAVTARGTPAWMPSPPHAWPIPSYASRAFQARVRAWYAEVARVLAPSLAPEGPVVAIGVDNEAQLFFRTGAYDLDYHPDAIAWFGSEPPRAWDPADPGSRIAWIKFKDAYLARALGELAGMLDEVGLGGLARFHNLPPGHHGLYELRGIQRAIGGPVGIDAYTARTEFRELRRRAIACASNATPVPIAFEVGVGFFPWFPPLDRGDDPDRERDHLLTLLAAGLRGFNVFMAVERDRYYGAAISKDGRVESHAAWLQTLIATLDEVDWPALGRRASIAVIDSRADARFGAASATLDPLTPVLAEALGLGPGGAAELGTETAATTARRWQTAILDALELAQVPYAILEEAADEAELAGYRAVVLPTGDRVDRALWQRVIALAEAKRTLVVIGPSTPTHDELGATLDTPAPRRIGKIRDGSLDDVPGLAVDLAGIAGELTEAWTIEQPDLVRAYAYAAADGVVKAVFVISDAPRATTAVLRVGGDVGVRDPFTGERPRIVAGKATIAMSARGVRMLVVGAAR